MRLVGKVALISGGARGMGAAEARLFAREGAQVIIGDILAAEGGAVEADIRAKGGEAAFVRLDVTSEADWQKAVGLAQSRFGKLNVLVNNAGIGGGSRIEDTTAEDWNRMMDVNAKGVFLGTKAVIAAMRRAGGGSIVNISSQLGLVGAAPGRSRPAPADDLAHPARPVRRARRGGVRRPLPGLRRVRLRHRQRARHRRGLDSSVAGAGPSRTCFDCVTIHPYG